MNTTFTDIGITASREGISEYQHRALITFLHRARSAGALRFHHGCCVGGDETGAVIAHNLGYRVIGHPPVKTDWRSPLACGVSNELREPTDYLSRDRDIVDDIGALIGLPNRPEVWKGSGTWYTVHHAQKLNRPRLVMLPNGQAVEQVGVDALWSLERAADPITDRRIVKLDAHQGYTLNPVQHGVEVTDADGRLISDVDLTGSPIHVPGRES